MAAVPVTRRVCARARAALSSSSAAPRQVTGSHLLRIRDYALVHAGFPSGTFLASGEFHAGDYACRLRYYPHGANGLSDGSVYAQLNLEDKEETVAAAACRVSILDRDGNPAYTRAMGPHRSTWGDKLVTRVDLGASLERLLDDDGCLNVLCDVNVLHKLDGGTTSTTENNI